MADKDRSDQGWQAERGDELDRELDAALAKYAAVEPRAGLEDRILANLRAEQTQVADRAWWRWSAAAALAAVLVVAVALAWRSSEPPHPAIASHPSVTTPSSHKPATQVVANGGGNVIRSPGHGAARRTIAPRPAVVVAAEPRLDQFPSPRPLSEQEKMLLDYVEQYPAEAALIAKAQTELLEREEKEKSERYGPPPAGTEPQNRQHFESPNL